MPEVSVIIPTFNRGTVIEESINSVLSQTYSDFEILVIDDGSTDNTKEIVEKIGNKKIRFIQLGKNCGACYARNVGIENAKGKYIAFQDSDDIWYPNKLEKQLAFLQRNSADMTFCQLVSKVDGSVYGKTCPRRKYRDSVVTFSEVLKNFSGSTQTFLVKKHCFETVKFDEKLPRYQDWEFLMQITQSYRVIYQAESLVLQKLRKDSISTNPQKGFIALQYVLKKYENEYRNCAKGKANILSYQATFVIQSGGRADRYLIDSLNLNPFSLHHWIKYILYKMKLLQRRYER